jgi:hypothetical protein
MSTSLAPIDKVVGTFVGVGFLVTAAGFCGSVREHRIKKNHFSEKVVWLQGLSTVGWAAYMVNWIHEVSWINLGRALPLVQAACYGPLGIVYAASTIDDNHTYQMLKVQERIETDPQEKKKVSEKKHDALLKLVSSVAFLVWNLLGLLSIVTGAAIPPLLILGCLGAGLVASVRLAQRKIMNTPIDAPAPKPQKS